jgi:hypothetical protein
MAKVREERYGSKRPKLERDDLDGDVGVLTIAGFDEAKFEDDDGSRVTPFIWFEEMGDKVLFLNKTQVGYIIERLGDESDDWMGQRVPIEKHTATFNGKRHEKLWVSPPEKWDEYLGLKRGRGPAKAKKPARRGKK